jgi:BirA family biotin operon repressor/biotin-[acetyl-CoA-carboxylase] ligase
MADRLPVDFAAALESARSRLPTSASIHYFHEIGSTNDFALSMAASGAPEGTVVFADQQTAGRGRRGRAWYSPAGAGIYLSCIVRPAHSTGLALLSLAAGLATANAITATTGLPLELKWPNDVVVGRPWRKLGGILCEAAGSGPRINVVVVGIGVNVQPAAYPPELQNRATSIEAELGRPAERGHVSVEILVRLLQEVARIREGDRARVLSDWRRLGHAGLADEPVRWQDQDGTRRGVAKDLDDDGALIVWTGGRTERLVAGEVTWERMT